jgi:hypothetical protein
MVGVPTHHAVDDVRVEPDQDAEMVGPDTVKDDLRRLGRADQRVLDHTAVAGLDQQAEDRLLLFPFAIMFATGNVRPCHGQSDVPVFGLLLPDRTRMVCIRRARPYLVKGEVDDESWRGVSADRTWR